MCYSCASVSPPRLCTMTMLPICKTHRLPSSLHVACSLPVCDRGRQHACLATHCSTSQGSHCVTCATAAQSAQRLLCSALCLTHSVPSAKRVSPSHLRCSVPTSRLLIRPYVAMSMMYMRLLGGCSTLATSMGLTTPLQMQYAAVGGSCKPGQQQMLVTGLAGRLACYPSNHCLLAGVDSSCMQPGTSNAVCVVAIAQLQTVHKLQSRGLVA